jgi:hypothetical protein
MANPATSRFWVSWQDDAHRDGSLEDDVVEGAEAAIEWGRVRSDVVWIRLGNRGDTYFSAGVRHPADPEPDSDYVPHWPPAGPPPGGWWEPPPKPDRSEIRAIRERVAAGEMGTAEAKPAGSRGLVRVVLASECLWEHSRIRGS